METPPANVKKKTLTAYSSSKNATPCRRVGLGRPSSGSSNKFLQIRKVSSSPFIDNQTENVMQETTPTLSSSEFLSKPNKELNKDLLRVRRCLVQKHNSFEIQGVKRPLGVQYDTFHVSPPNTNNRQVKKCKSELLLPENCMKFKKIKENKSDFDFKPASTKSLIEIVDGDEEISEEIISKFVLSLLEKSKRLEQLKVQNMYAKKHKLEELRGETDKWRTAGQEALRWCMRLATQVGCTVTIPQLMQQHGFPPHLMSYNADDDDFN